MAYIREDGDIKWCDDRPYVGAVVAGYAWNCPEEKDCPDRMSRHAFSLNIGKRKIRMIEVLTCGHWNPMNHVCSLDNTEEQSDDKTVQTTS